jgi:epoxyqueuosine reductase QueG
LQNPESTNPANNVWQSKDVSGIEHIRLLPSFASAIAFAMQYPSKAAGVSSAQKRVNGQNVGARQQRLPVQEMP